MNRKPRHYTKGFIQRCITALVAVIKQDAPSHGAPYPSGYLPCHYHGTDGNKSIIGYLISDNEYDSELEGHTLEYLPLVIAINLSLGYVMTDDDKELLEVLTDCHDFGSESVYANGGDFVEHMLDQLERAVIAHDVPDQFKEYI